MQVTRKSRVLPAAMIAMATLGLGSIGAVAVEAKNQPLPSDIREMPDKLIKYKHLKNQRASDRMRYDIKVEYGRASKREAVTRKPRKMIAFTRILISRAGEDDYRKPSADRLSELFPGSMVYASLNAAAYREGTAITGPTCGKKQWYKSSEFTTFVTLRKRVCTSGGIDSGHRARIGRKMLVDLKLD